MKNSVKNKSIKPFLKWAGGKRWLVANHKNLFPESYERYIEPFLGSGAVFFHLSPTKGILGDSNKELIKTYKGIRKNWKLVYKYLSEHQENHSKDYYYEIRKWDPSSLEAKAARLIYLNRTCWNGLYRVNKQGQFNVPIGTRQSVIFEDDNFEDISKLLQNAELIPGDFELVINKSTKGDFLFVDPPYTVRHNHNGFIKYNEKLFSWTDQERLFEALIQAKKRGAKIVSTNANHQNIIELYQGEFELKVVSRTSSISSKSATRKKFEELIILT